jgi:hypothetical protein
MHMTSTIAEISVIAHLRIGNRTDDVDRNVDRDGDGARTADGVRNCTRKGDGVRNGDDNDTDRNGDRALNGDDDDAPRKGVRDNSSRSVLCMAEASSLMAGFAPTCSAL